MSGRGRDGDAPVRTATEFASAQARDAWDRGWAAIALGSFDQACAWFARACRLAPGDVTPIVAHAGACMAAGRIEQAAALLRTASEQVDARLIWVGLASACARLGRTDEAAAALHQALSRHAGGAGDEALADRVAEAAGYAGWRGLDFSGRPIGRVDAARRGRGQKILGDPIDLAAIGRLEGVVEIDGDGLSGWAWHPGDPAREPILTVSAGDAVLHVHATDRRVAALRPLNEPRGFRLSRADLAGFCDPITVAGPDGVELAGSPVFLRSLAAPQDDPSGPAEAARCPDRPVAVVVPVYRGAAETRDCLRDVLATVPRGSTVFVVDDASPEPALVALVDAFAASGRVRLLRQPRNGGFPAAANAGLRAALALDPPHDVVLLNSDTRMAAGWLDRLARAVQASGDIGTATPLSNDATIASYPASSGGNPVQAGRALAAMSRAAALANPEIVVDAPTGVGFCLYMRRECLVQTGLLRQDAFAQGYGEENDFCRRASRCGWRHVIVPGAYVGHVGGRSFGAAREALLARNLRVLERLHPGYRALVQDWISGDPLAAARRRLDLRRWLALARQAAPSVLLVTHDDGGGVERCVQARAVALREAGQRPIILRPVRTPPGFLRVDDPAFPNLIFRMPEDLDELAAALRPCRPAFMEVHHLLGHAPAALDLARRLGVAYEMRLHDYAAFCPRITLTAASDRYCGEPDVAGCVACVAAHGSLLAEDIAPPELRARSAADLAGARRVVAPSADMAARMRRHFPGVRIDIEPHEADPPRPLAAPPPRAAALALVVGAIGRAKGFDILLACARDAAARDLPLRFVVVGRTIDDEALFDTGRVDVTGPYREGEAAGLIAEQAATIGFIPSLWPETWCFALGEVFAAGLAAVAFDIGAQSERIRRTGRGRLLPLGAPPAAINQVLLRPALAAQANVMQTVRNRVL